MKFANANYSKAVDGCQVSDSIRLSFLNREMRPVVEPGTFKIMVGGNSVDFIETTLIAVAL
jgi:hypothetical protein